MCSSRVLVVCGSLLAGCFDPIPPDTVTRPGAGEVVGAVTDQCSSKPLAGVLVTPQPVENGSIGSPALGATTDAGGRYALELDQGEWQLTFSKKGYQSVEKTVVVRSSATEKIDLTVPPVPAQLPQQARLDVLFVVDNSNSMSEEQQSLAQAFPRFMNALLLYGFTLDLRVGVISTDLGAGSYGIPSCEAVGGDGGKLQASARVAGCAPPSDPYISVVGTTTNVPDDMVNDAFACIVELGTGGCGFEQPLGAALKAVDGQTNPGFPRADAVLAVVLISDEDDCTASDTALYDPNARSPLTSFRCFERGVTCDGAAGTPGPKSGCKPAAGGQLLDVDSFVNQLTQGRGAGRVFFAAIAGPTDKVEVGLDGSNLALRPSCQTASTAAVPGIRLRAVADALGPNSSFDTICVADLGATLANVARRIAETTIFSPCTGQ